MNTKLFFAVAGATLLLFSCQKEIEPTNNPSTGNGFSFTAGIEKLATRADINSSNELVWAQGDKIGIFVNDDSWGDNQFKQNPFTLEGAGGSTTGKFIWDYDDGNFISDKATAAFFPWNGRNAEGSVNNVWNGTVYFKMPSAYSSYTSGQMLTPLVAVVTRGDSDYNPIRFKHAGAAVKVTINNLPAGAHSLEMTVDGAQLYGEFNTAVPSSDEEDPSVMTLDNAEDATKNAIKLNIEPADSEREFTFLFPTPALTTPKLSFLMYDKNDVLVWSKNLKAQANNVGRGEVLVMPAIDITPYEQFLDGSGDPNVSDEWTVIGTVNGTNWNADIPMITNGTVCIAKGVSFQAGGEFKVRKDGGWDTAYPSSNHVVSDAGTYDIIFNTSDNSVRAVATGCPYPEVPVTVGIDGNMSEWASVPGLVQTATSSNAIEQVKAYADEDNIYVYVKRAPKGRYTEVWSTSAGYYYFFFDLDNDASTGSTSHSNGGSGNLYEAYCYLFPFSATKGEFVASPSATGSNMAITGITCAGACSDSDSDYYTEVEIAFPRTNFPNISSETIGVRVYGSKDGGLTSELSFAIEREHHEISIDGDMSDWAKVPGVTTTGIIKAFKMWNDETNFYFYNSCEPGSRGDELWNGGGYYYYDFDLDNDATTGDYTDGSHGTFDAQIAIFPFAGTSAAPEIGLVKFYNANGISTSDITLDGVITDDLIEVEFVIPRANFTTQVNSGDVISVYNWRAKDGNSTTLTYTVQ